jgi:hypothetical protein
MQNSPIDAIFLTHATPLFYVTCVSKWPTVEKKSSSFSHVWPQKIEKKLHERQETTHLPHNFVQTRAAKPTAKQIA